LNKICTDICAVHLISSHPCIAACLSFLLHAFVYVIWTGRVHLVTTEALTAVRMWAAAFYFRPGWVSVPFTHIFVKSSMCDVSCRPHNFLSSYSKRHTTCVEHATSSSFCHLSLLRTCLVQGCWGKNIGNGGTFPLDQAYKNLFSIFLWTKNKAKP
jgi:hypothetical protein